MFYLFLYPSNLNGNNIIGNGRCVGTFDFYEDALAEGIAQVEDSCDDFVVWDQEEYEEQFD